MRPAHVYASMSAEQHTELITALHGPWRTATRMLIVVLSAILYGVFRSKDWI